MRAPTHIVAGVLCGVCLAGSGQAWGVTAACALAGGVGGLLPDLDHPRSMIARRVGIFGAPVRLFVAHRGALHSLCAAILVFMAALSLNPDLRLYGLAAAAGYASHIALDAMTVYGVPLLWPMRRRVRLLRLRTGGVAELVVRLALVVCLLWVFFG